MSDTIEINKGEAIRLELQWKDSAGDPINLFGSTLQIPESFPGFLADALLEVVDEELGKASFSLTAAASQGLLAGRTNWFRLEFVNGDGANDVTPLIWIDVK